MELHAQLSCSMPAELMKKGVTWQERAVYVEAVLFCRERLTDGIIHRSLLGLWMPDMTPKARTVRLDALVARRALLEHSEGWQFPPNVWARWNPSKAEVEAKREAEAQRLREYRQRKRAVRESYEERTDVRTESVRAPYKQPEPEPEPEPEPIASPSTSLHPAATNGGGIEATVHELAERFRA